MIGIQPNEPSDEELEAKRREFHAEFTKFVGGDIELPDGKLPYAGSYLRLTQKEKRSLAQIGAILWSYRDRHNKSEEEVANALGVSTSFLHLCEEGFVPEGDWPPKFLYNYAKAIGDWIWLGNMPNDSVYENIWKEN